MSMGSTEGKIKTAVITGKHPFDVPAFHAAFRSLTEIDFYPQHMEDFAADIGERRAEYDVLLFFNFHQETPGSSGSPADEASKAALDTLGDSEQGIFILHHALLAYPDWPPWARLVGLQAPSWRVHMDINLSIQVANRNHPITEGLNDWTMQDETYIVGEPDGDSEILLITEDPKSMRSIAWTRRYKHARVFCFQSGHDHNAYENPNFRRVISRGIQWAAGRL
ncbi:MAG: ThuA domain-containing protein [Chloroflexota bacterium]|nr:ThuA domain-containing protein [Chloroflexota bacterium]MDE2908260.1 ThuA domain-containing protein [Chloroflexota bacterium]